DGKTSDVWLLLFVPGPPDQPERGVTLGFWMGKDSKVRPLGNRGAGGGSGFAESGGRNWVHSAATVLAFLQAERGLLKHGYKFRPLIEDAVLADLKAQTLANNERPSFGARSHAHSDVQQGPRRRPTQVSDGVGLIGTTPSAWGGHTLLPSTAQS